ncbi:MAG TPA: class I SAM-dependent methyltransferase [Dehalococcoidia bacterium]|nr:class I SAM-dependent methyltransferase [Dehalococcoidia bacterium]
MTSADTERNIRHWTEANERHTGPDARRAWSASEIVWGVFQVPESEIRVLGDVSGLDVVELGCGTAYFSAWLARLGGRPVGVDPTPAQLATARRMQQEFGIEFPLVEAGGEDVPLPATSFDLAISEHGACTWSAPYLWISEAARLLRPGGRLIFLHTTPLAELCFPDEGTVTTTLQRPYFGLHRSEYSGGGVEFQLTHGDWIGVLRENGFAIEGLVELQAPENAARHEYYSDFDPAWGRSWPAEEIWLARKQGRQ